jgi:hypothetical protein
MSQRCQQRTFVDQSMGPPRIAPQWGAMSSCFEINDRTSVLLHWLVVSRPSGPCRRLSDSVAMRFSMRCASQTFLWLETDSHLKICKRPLRRAASCVTGTPKRLGTRRCFSRGLEKAGFNAVRQRVAQLPNFEFGGFRLSRDIPQPHPPAAHKQFETNGFREPY